MKRYYCCACGEMTVEINPDHLKEALDSGCKFLYVYCRNCGAVHHHDDVIACSIEETCKIAGENAANGMVH